MPGTSSTIRLDKQERVLPRRSIKKADLETGFRGKGIVQGGEVECRNGEGEDASEVLICTTGARTLHGHKYWAALGIAIPLSTGSILMY